MIKLINTTGGTLTAGQTLPITVKYNTNNNTSFKNNQISINKPGYYEINANVNLTATATGAISLTLYADGTAISETVSTETFTAIGDTHTIVINDIEKVISNYTTTDKTNIYFVVSAGCTLNNANVSVVEIR